MYWEEDFAVSHSGCKSFLQELSKGIVFWNGLKGTTQKLTLFHLLLKEEEISTCRKVWCLLTAFSCSISLEMQLLIHSLCLKLQLLLSCPISAPPAQPALNIGLKTNGLVTVEAAGCDQNHEQQKAKPWGLNCSPQVLHAS